MPAVVDTLNSSERKLVRAAEHDSVADLRGHEDGHAPPVRAELLRDLCAEGRHGSVTDRIRMIGGRVRGRLDLSGATLAHPLSFKDCVFEDTIDLRHARAEKPLIWTGERGGAAMAEILADDFESAASLTIAGVTVAGVISLRWASIRGDLRLTNSHLVPAGGQAVAGQDLRVRRTLFLDGPEFHAEGEVCLRSAHVKEDVDCRHGCFSNPSGRSIDAAHLIVEGELLLEGYHDDPPAPAHHGKYEDFHSDGEVNLQWAQVHRLRATGGKFANPTGYALHADALHAKDGIYLDRGFEATSEVRLVGASIGGELCCTEGIFTNPSGLALNAERIQADDVYLDRGFVARGQVRFTDAQVKRQFNATCGDFRNERADDYALNADGLVCGGEVYLNRGFHAVGAVSLTGAEIAGELNCTAGAFHNHDGHALFADGLTTSGMVYLDKGFQADGEVRFARATVGRQLVGTDGTFDNQHHVALDLTGLECTGDVLLNSTGAEGKNCWVIGQLLMRDAHITRDLNLTNARLHGGEGLDARGMQVRGCLTWILDSPPEGRINLSNAQISRLNDTPNSWPEHQYVLTGLAYQSVTDDSFTLERRKTWLRQTDAYSPDAYQQLARVYRLGGNESAAQEILVASQRDLRSKDRGNLSRRSRAWSWFIDRFVGYGYRLHRPFVWLLAAGLVGGVVYLIAQHNDLIMPTGRPHVPAIGPPPAGTPPFYPFPYSFQLLIPGLDLRETANWLPDAAKNGGGLFIMIFTWIMIVFGWILATAVVAGITRLFRQR
jgi:hypothetical protein